MSRNSCVCVPLTFSSGLRSHLGALAGGFSSTSSPRLQLGGPTRFLGLGLAPDSAHGAELQDQWSEASQELLDFHPLLQSKLDFPPSSQQDSPIVIPYFLPALSCSCCLSLEAAAHSGLLNIMEIIHQPRVQSPIP